MEVLFGHKFFGYDVLPWKPWLWQLESVSLQQNGASISSNVAANSLYVLEEDAVWKIGVLAEV